MDKIKWTDDQQKVIDSRGKNLLVSASAGSGKTSVMIERVFDLMTKDKIPITDFLIVTFTNASADDMKKKLSDRLYEKADDEFVLGQIENLQTSDISSLHSFCSKLVSTYFYEAQVDPAYHVVDEVEATELKNQAASELFDEKERSDDEAFFELFDIFQKNRKDDNFKEILFKIIDFSNSILNGREWLKSAVQNSHDLNLSTNECVRTINNYVCYEVKKDILLAENFAKKCSNFGAKKYSEHFLQIASELSIISEKKSYLQNAKAMFEIAFVKIPTVSDDYKFLSDEARFVKKTIKDHVDNYRDNFISPDEQFLVEGNRFAKDKLMGLLSLAFELDDKYSKLKRDANGLDFNDLEVFALKILSNDMVRASLKNKYKYVFVDEYQDINEVQEKIISAIAGENNRFMVGDIKQSIYRFRFCDPDIFLGAYKSYKNQPSCEVVDLKCNFRSDKKILKFVDLVFSGVMTERFGGIDYQKTSIFSPGEDNLECPDSVNLCFIDTEKQKEDQIVASGVYSVKNHAQEEGEQESQAVAEAVYVADKISMLTRADNPDKIRLQDIAILVQSRNTFTAKFLETLREMGIAVSSDEETDIAEESYISEILNFMKLCLNQKDDFLLFKVLKSNLFNFSDKELVLIRKIDKKCSFYDCINKVDETVSGPLREKLERFLGALARGIEECRLFKIRDFAQKIVDEFCLKQIALSRWDGKDRAAKIDSFLASLTDKYAYEVASDLDNFSLTMQNQTGEDAVKVMSIHASKGIEFKAVFLVNTSKGFAMMSMMSDLLVSRKFGVAMNYFNFDNRTKNFSIPYSAIKIVETRKLVEEDQRVLYVALTRAKAKLFVVCSKERGKLLASFPDRANAFSNWFEPIIYNELNGKHNDILNFEAFSISDLKFKQKREPAQFLLDGKHTQITEFKYEFLPSTLVPLKSSVSKLLNSGVMDVDFDDEYENFEDNLDDDKLRSFAERGTAYHKVFENINFKAEDMEREADRAIGCLPESERELVDRENVLGVLKLEFFKNIGEGDIILKEREFFANLPISLLGAEGSDCFILQGVVDLLLIRDHEIILVDYKTGKPSDEKLQHYKFQLNLYGEAMSRAYNLKVKSKLICFVDTKQMIEI